MHYPAQIYAIYPFKSDGTVAGVYVGSAYNVVTRINAHLLSKGKNQSTLHDLMRANGFTFQILGEIKSYEQAHLEYDWMIFFKDSNVKVFNKVIDKVANSQEVHQKFMFPVWNGQAVVWSMKEKRKPSSAPLVLLAKDHGISVSSIAKTMNIKRTRFNLKIKGEYGGFSTEEFEELKTFFPNTPIETLEKCLTPPSMEGT